MKGLFYDLSVALTGVACLDAKLAAEYLERLRDHATWGERIGPLLEKYRDVASGPEPEQAIEREIMDDPELGPIARQTILLWYTGAFFDQKAGKTSPPWSYGNPDHYFAGLLWSVARAHPPMLSGGYFGQWHYPPEN